MGRLHQHRTGSFDGFTKRHEVHRLVHFEMTETMTAAIAREKPLKAWRRDWKIALIERDSPFWEDRAVGFGFAPLAVQPMDADFRQHDGLGGRSMTQDKNTGQS